MTGPAVVGSFDPVSWRKLQRDLKDLGPAIRKDFNNEIKVHAQNIMSDAKANASWSSRIPGSLSISVTASRVGVKANRRKAPHARAMEGVRRAGFGTVREFRHPVYGNQNIWVSQPTKPFLAPAIRANQAAFFESAHDSIITAARTVGWTK